MGENICQESDQQGINFQNIKKMYVAQYQTTQSKNRQKI